MPEISVQNSTYERLQRHAKPFVDTPETVIVRALDALDQFAGESEQTPSSPAAVERHIDPRALPNLTHTKILTASIGGKTIAKANWNLLLDEVLRCAMKRLGSFEKVRQLCPINMVKGRKEDEGYGYLPEIDISVQGLDANGACRAIVTGAQGLGLSLDVTFMWRHKEAAAYPGERARVQFTGANRSEI